MRVPCSHVNSFSARVLSMNEWKKKYMMPIWVSDSLKLLEDSFLHGLKGHPKPWPQIVNVIHDVEHESY